MGTPAPNATPPAVPLLSVLGETIAAARAAGRNDLVGRREVAAHPVRAPPRRLVVPRQLDQG
ncbi:hypothetical protein, partial [Nocardia abscessus]|uniref:hypothetical protein n=1 Tax=Nocardia abscessus TaxID=120957 RepID=UPI002456A086